MQTLWADFRNWLAQPFAQPISAAELFFGIGLIIVILALWSRIIGAIGKTID